MSLSTQNYAVFECMKRLLTEKICFRSATPDEEMKAFFDETKKLLSSTEDSVPQSEMEQKIDTAAENFLIILTNCALYFDNHPRFAKLTQKTKSKKISFVTTEIDCEKACKYLKDNIYTDEMYKHFKQFENTKFAQTAKAPLTRKILKICIYFLLFLLFVGFVIWLSGFFVSPSSDTPEFKNIFDQFGYWVHYDLLGNEKPLSSAAQWINTSHETGKITLTVFCIVLAFTLLFIIVKILYFKHKRKTFQQWHSISLVFAKFTDVSMRKIDWEE